MKNSITVRSQAAWQSPLPLDNPILDPYLYYTDPSGQMMLPITDNEKTRVSVDIDWVKGQIAVAKKNLS